jgi:hypothetical protein
MKFLKFASLGVLVGLLLLLSACSSNAGTLPQEDAQFVGIVGGSSNALTLNGQRLDVSKAIITLDGDAASASVLQPGVELEVSGRSNRSDDSFSADRVDAKTRVKGQIDKVNADGLEVVGVLVSVDSNTVIANRATDGTLTTITLANLQVNDYLEVYGVPRNDNSVLATRIVRKVEDNVNKVELRIKIRSVDMTAKTFTYGLGTHTVNFANAEVRGTLADGAMLRVKGTRSGLIITAERVRTGERGNDDNGNGGERKAGKIELEGIISNLDTNAKTFNILDFAVNYNGAEVKGSLADGVWVEVEGRIDGATSTILAREVKLEGKWDDSDDDGDDDHGGHGGNDDNDDPGGGDNASDFPQAEGTADAVNTSAMTLSVAGSSFWADSTTKVERNDVHVSFNALQAGQWLEVRYDSSRQKNGAAYAVKIEIYSQGSGDAPGEVELTGTVSSFDASSQTFMMGSTKVTVQVGTEYKNANNDDISASVFWGTNRTNARIKVEGSSQNGVLVSREIKLQ